MAARLRAELDAASLHGVQPATPVHALSCGQLARVALIGALVVASHDAAFLAALAPTHTMRWHRDGWRYEPVA
ncbi:hypothetical protein WJ61_03270 [Burkholderia ubonensis]|uniref:hypothetical protein n=1 Tax=Burkholderia ubonensis TaxID=101571 RepID=UPI00075B54A4|nr:hypothetical protein [Burkholderia ubonensis]KVM80412.1 hypothetical protein WJ61_03270 [Burkholderia ubonensis]OJA37131.1 hypothetical protein BGV47_19020 [Burkholderia ubonensis]OJA86825.1 hypothetical protein BGV49_12685 [Burkholderia ubonensis]OJB22772.1 hypothetical protein BGV55_24970 [Burkholderia ubonensis]